MRKFLFWVRFNLWWPVIVAWTVVAALAVVFNAMLSVVQWFLASLAQAITNVVAAALAVIYEWRPEVPRG